MGKKFKRRDVDLRHKKKQKLHMIDLWLRMHLIVRLQK